jgi:DNA-binding GntR family transcriptional regulator
VALAGGRKLEGAVVPFSATDLGVVPIERRTVQERVYSQLRGLLMRGRFPPDQPLTIQSIADLFGTSGQPVREAIRQLVAENALEALPNRSARVPAMSAARLEDLRHARLAIEGAAVEQAVSRVTPAALQRLRAMVAAETAADDAAEPEASVAENQAFHFHLYRLSGSAILPPIIEGLWLQIGPYLRRIAETFDARGGRGTAFHSAILDGVARRDAAAARAALARDINRSCDLVLAALEGEGA